MKRLVLALVAGIFAYGAHAATLPATPQTLGLVLASAKPGDLVQLAAGTYPAFSLDRKIFSPPIVLAGRGAILQGFNLTNSGGLTFQDLDLAGPAGGKGYPFFASSVSDLRFDGVRLTADPGVFAAMRLQGCKNVVFTRSEVSKASNGISWANCAGFEVSGSTFHDLWSDGISGAGGQQVRFVGNSFTAFRPAAGDHPDAIQIWTANGGGPSSDVLIQGNTYVRGPGGPEVAVQGVFLTAGGGDARMTNVRIKDNLIAGGMYNSVMAVGVDGLEITGNVVAGFPDQQAFIRWGDNTAMTMTGNQAQLYVASGLAYGAVPPGNAALSVASDGGAALLAARTPVAPSDPRDAQIATLKAQVADLAAQIATLKAQGAAQADELATAQGKATQAAQALSTAVQDLDHDRAALAAIRGQAQGALDSNPSARPPAP